MSSTTRLGRRVRIASSVAVESAAARVWWPSSSRMPPMSIRMSASSSTIRMSCAMTGCFRQLLRRTGLARTLRANPPEEREGNARAAAGAILEHQRAAMIFHDFFDNRQSQSGTFGARCHIRLGEPLAVLQRQALAIVLDDDQRTVLGLDHAHGDAPMRPCRTRRRVAALDRFGGVLQ